MATIINASNTTGLTMTSDLSGVLQFQQNGVAMPQCRAWVNFQGGSTNTAGTINGSYNVSSVTVNGTGDYTVNFSNSLSSAFYAVSVSIKPSSGQTTMNAKNGQVNYATTPTTSAVRIMTSSTGGFENFEIVYVAIFI